MLFKKKEIPICSCGSINNIFENRSIQVYSLNLALDEERESSRKLSHIAKSVANKDEYEPKFEKIRSTLVINRIRVCYFIHHTVTVQFKKWLRILILSKFVKFQIICQCILCEVRIPFTITVQSKFS